MHSKLLLFLKLMPLFSAAGFGYWAIYWEMIVWHKGFVEAVMAAQADWILFFGSLIVEVALLLPLSKRENNPWGSTSSSKVKVSEPSLSKPLVLVSESEFPSDPWVGVKQEPHGDEKPSFLKYIRGLFRGVESWGYKSAVDFERSKIHIRFFLKAKRLYVTCLFFLFAGLGIVAFPASALFSFLFFSAAYIFLDYLWKTRRIKWEKPKE